MIGIAQSEQTMQCCCSFLFKQIGYAVTVTLLTLAAVVVLVVDKYTVCLLLCLVFVVLLQTMNQMIALSCHVLCDMTC